MLVLGMTAALTQGARLQNIAHPKAATAELAEVNDQNNLAQAEGQCGPTLKRRRIWYANHLKSHQMF